MVGISREGDWFYFTGEIEQIRSDRWLEPSCCTPVVLSPSRKAHELLLLDVSGSFGQPFVLRNKNGLPSIPIDAAFPVLHGKNGEDGSIQGAIELAGIPLVGCGTLASALCMDKDRAHKLARLAGVLVPRSFVAHPWNDEQEIFQFAAETGYPIFVKPVRAGSSYGISKVQKAEDLLRAVRYAFQYDSEVILEEAIPGFEVGCAVMGNKDLITGEADEIELSGGFFDYKEKYTLETSYIHVPARIAPEKAAQIKDAAKRIYRALGCSGFARVDLFLTPSGDIYFNEVNTIPGFTEHSRYPGMMKAAGISFPEILTNVIQLALGQ